MTLYAIWCIYCLLYDNVIDLAVTRHNYILAHWHNCWWYWYTCFNSLAPGKSGCDSKNGIFNLVLLIGIFRSSHDNALQWMPQDLTDDKSTLVQVMAWCHQATSHYLSQCWLSSLSSYGIARPQWVNQEGPVDLVDIDTFQPRRSCWPQVATYPKLTWHWNPCKPHYWQFVKLQTITWTSVDLSSAKYSDIHLNAISHEMPQSSITKISLKNHL